MVTIIIDKEVNHDDVDDNDFVDIGDNNIIKYQYYDHGNNS